MRNIFSIDTKEKTILWLLFFSCLLILLRYHNLVLEDSNLKSVEGKYVTLIGIIDSEPDSTPGGKKFTLRVESVNNLKISTSYISVKSDSFDEKVQYGTKVSFGAKLQKPKPIIGDDGRIFDYPMYLAKSGIFYTADKVHLEVLGTEQGNSVFSFLYKIKKSFMSAVEKSLPAPASFLANGLVISGKGSMSKELQTEFQRVGLIHIVVLSGSNISIVGEAVARALSFLPTLWSSLIGAIGIVLFSCMTGGGATVVRSAIMSVIALAARVTNRQNDALMSLSVAAIFMLIQNPLLLAYDPSFQLSFAASLGLILYSPRVLDMLISVSDKLINMSDILKTAATKIPKPVKDFLEEIVSSSLATQIATLPLILKISGMMSIVSLPVNILLLPLIPYTMLSVFVLGVTSFISIFISKLFAFVSWIFLTVELQTVHTVSALEFAVIQFSPISDNTAIAIYLIFIAEYFWYLYRKKQVPA